MTRKPNGCQSWILLMSLKNKRPSPHSCKYPYKRCKRCRRNARRREQRRLCNPSAVIKGDMSDLDLKQLQKLIDADAELWNGGWENGWRCAGCNVTALQLALELDEKMEPRGLCHRCLECVFLHTSALILEVETLRAERARAKSSGSDRVYGVPRGRLRLPTFSKRK